jgi:WD40 repeat protein
MPTIAPHDFGESCLFAGFLNEVAFFATVDGMIHHIGAREPLFAHKGLASACPTPDGALATGGEDGLVRLTRHDGSSEIIGETGRKWVSVIAAGPNGAIGWSAGKTVIVREGGGKHHEIAHERTIEGLAFFPKGLRIAAAHYDAVSLHFPATKGVATMLPWKGAHLGVTVSPDATYVVSAMQENALHGWRLADVRDMRMSGYPAKTKSMSWSVKGRYLATSGAPAAIVWPFMAKDGPMGKAPLELGTRGDSMVTQVVCHPADELAAIGYQDGMILLVRFSDAREVLLRRAGDSAITALGWDKFGARLAFGCENGNCGVVDLRG